MLKITGFWILISTKEGRKEGKLLDVTLVFCILGLYKLMLLVFYLGLDMKYFYLISIISCLSLP